MSKESYEWLNQNILVGYTDKRGQAWHYKESAQGVEPNHYAGAVPVADVLRRLFDFQVIECPLLVEVPGPDESKLYIPVDGRKAMVTADTFDTLGIFKDSYRGHDYSEWLLEKVATLLDADLSISSAGLLRNRAQAWVEISIADTLTTPSGVSYRPNLLASTSFDGSLVSSYRQTVTATVCDNTLAAAHGEGGPVVKVKHSKYSHLRVANARDALGLVLATSDAFAAEVEALCAQTVTDDQWACIVDKLVPVSAEPGRGQTVAENKRDKLESLYRHDNRVSPWAGSAFGVLQAFNTYATHFATVRRTNRVERNLIDVLTGKSADRDTDVLTAVASVLN